MKRIQVREMCQTRHIHELVRDFCLISPMEHSPSSEVNSRSANEDILPPFMEPDGSVPHP